MMMINYIFNKTVGRVLLCIILTTLNESVFAISEQESIKYIESIVTESKFYGDNADYSCINYKSEGLVNEGFTIKVVNKCQNNELIGRWRVAETDASLYIQMENGKYKSIDELAREANKCNKESTFTKAWNGINDHLDKNGTEIYNGIMEKQMLSDNPSLISPLLSLGAQIAVGAYKGITKEDDCK